MLAQAVQTRTSEGKRKQVEAKRPSHMQSMTRLVATGFFVACENHSENIQRNRFCMDCGAALCQISMHSHSGCRRLQIFRHVECDVVRVKDVGLLFDTAGVQQFIVNSHKAVRLKARVTTGLSKKTSGDAQNCQFCDRFVPAECDYCSLDCKIKAAKELNGLKAFNALLVDWPSVDDFNKEISSPSATTIPVASLTKAPITAKQLCKKRVRSHDTSESEVEDRLSTRYTSESPTSSATFTSSFPISQAVDHSSPPRRSRTRKRLRFESPSPDSPHPPSEEEEAAGALLDMFNARNIVA